MGGIVASTIAYFTAVLLFLSGVYGLVDTASSLAPDKTMSIAACFILFAAAWGCAYLGGI